MDRANTDVNVAGYHLLKMSTETVEAQRSLLRILQDAPAADRLQNIGTFWEIDQKTAKVIRFLASAVRKVEGSSDAALIRRDVMTLQLSRMKAKSLMRETGGVWFTLGGVLRYPFFAAGFVLAIVAAHPFVTLALATVVVLLIV